MIELAQWLAPLDGENPSGEDLRNDARFHDLERILEPQVKVVYDDRNKPTTQVSTPVDWNTVLARAAELRIHGRDLRLLVVVTRALANEEGLGGLAEGLTLIAKSFEAYWENMHPMLRAGPPRDAALRRINALLDLQNGQSGLLSDLRQRAMFFSPGIGGITGRDLEQACLDDRAMLQEAASGLNAAEKAILSKAHEQLIGRVRTAMAAFADRSATDLAALVEAARAARSAMDQLDVVVNARLETVGPAIPELSRFIDRVLASLERVQPAKVRAEQTVNQAAAPAAAPLPNGHVADFPSSISATGLPDRITSRDDVVKCLDLVVAFYDRTEPSSPIPHLARRVRRMVHMDFVELMEDLAPSGLKEFRLLAGMQDKDKKTAQKDER
ncbi:type VI secretion system protein TssA [Mesorhizobium sp. J428]|uniref:type VI secretion system protein TssA n=1 Tax=Mesorhizobium sp. J428 TaxID=2898440 RepID=UPI00215102F8|nr:type VI secretion system protein TssA [Mesorhizobium sp. J428]MCR5856340.1 type VI secretion system protein TssA [Mesorhizobium sp. J428]